MTSVEMATIVVAVLVAAVVQNSAGFGFALLGVPLMSITVETHHAVVISTVIGLGSSATQAWLGRADTDRDIATRMTLGALVGMPFGLLVFVLVSARGLKIVVGVCVLAIVVLLARRLDLRAAGRRLDIGAGVISGVLATSVSTNGPPLVFALQARHVPPDVFRPTINTVFAVSAVVSLLGFLATGEIDHDVVVGVLVAVVPLAAGIVIGRRLRPRLQGEVFRVVVLVLLAAAGLSAVATAVSG